jgi:YggT family protein
LRGPAGGARVITILYQIVNEILNLFKWAIILAAVFSMLVSFGVLDTRNRVVWTIGDFLYRVTEPALRPIRNMLPNFGGVDLSPLVLILIIWVLQAVLTKVYFAIAFGNVQGLLL